MSDSALDRLSAVIDARRGADPEASYVARLHAAKLDAVLKKIGEEATELVMAAKDADRAAIVHEAADLWFHTLVLLSRFDADAAAVVAELERRFGTSGLAEKAARG
ncbi:MAG: phosphoribosyl-ATP diphosphatase [Chromatiales bacterium]|nr:phosphoribosyl-ATP diphosphatase [Chromatiales bacterium]